MIIGFCNNFPSYAQNRFNSFTFLDRKFYLLHIDGAANVEMASCRTSKRISSKAVYSRQNCTTPSFGISLG